MEYFALDIISRVLASIENALDDAWKPWTTKAGDKRDPSQ
jgi:hypothetical protein